MSNKVIDMHRPRAVWSSAISVSTRHGLHEREAKQVARYAIHCLHNGSSAARAIVSAERYARVRAGKATWDCPEVE